MDEHRINLDWERGGATFERNNYPRDHRVRFQGGQLLNASGAAGYGGNPAHADPEQLLVASLSTCHFLTLLAVAANRGYVLDHYEDEASGVLGKDAEGRTMVTNVTLRPRIRFGGTLVPNREELEKLHERAHRACFLANSVKSEVAVEPRD